MPLQDVDLKAFTFIANNPKLRQKMIENLKEEGYTDHPLIRENDDFERRLESHIKPIKEENTELKKRLDEQERDRIWSKQRDSVRKGPFGFNDDKIKKLEERMTSKDAPQFPELDSQGRTAYQQAAMYFAHQDSPVSESTFPVLDFAGPSKKAETWRDLMNGSDKSKNPLNMNRRERRRLGDELWRQARDEQLADLQNR
jgi:hypothetical protein